MTAAERFESRVEKEPMSGCWLWTGTILSKGYGQLWVGTTGKRVLAHRYSYELVRGAIPDGKQLDHLCRVRSCVNPSHLEVVTARENVLRGIGRTARQARQTHCMRGHLLSPGNCFPSALKRGMRACRECSRVARPPYDPARRHNAWLRVKARRTDGTKCTRVTQ